MAQAAAVAAAAPQGWLWLWMAPCSASTGSTGAPHATGGWVTDVPTTLPACVACQPPGAGSTPAPCSHNTPCLPARCRERLRAALEDVCGKPAADSIQLQLAQDGSVLGAAFLAVAAAQWEAKHGSSGGDSAA